MLAMGTFARVSVRGETTVLHGAVDTFQRYIIYYLL